MTAAPSRAATLAGAVIVLYQRWISPAVPPACRYWPSCSEYARQAIRRHGVLAGGRAAVGRLLRCQPFAAGGVDPPR